MKKILLLVIFLGTQVCAMGQNLEWNEHNGIVPQINGIIENKKGVLFIGTDNGIYIYDYLNRTWNYQEKGFISPIVRFLNIKPDGKMFTCIGNSIYRSDNDGDNWKDIGLHDTSFWSSSFFIDKKGNIYTGLGSKGVYKSSNNGETWDILNDSSFKNRVTSIVVNNNENIYICVENNGILKSVDYGKTWKNIKIGSKVINNYYLFVDKNDNILVGGKTGIGFCKIKEDNDSLISINANFADKTIYCFSEDSTGSIYLGTSAGVYTLSKDYTKEQLIFNAFPVMFFFINPQNNLYVSHYNFIGYTPSKGNDWFYINYYFNPKGKIINSIYELPDGELLVGLDSCGIIKSYYNQRNFMERLSFPGKTKVWNISKDSQNNLYAFIDSLGTYISTDNGENWAMFDSSTAYFNIKGVLFDNDDNLFLATSEGLLLKKKAEPQWNNISFFAKNDISGIFQASGNRIFAYSLEWIYLSTDGGSNWVRESVGLPGDVKITAMAENSKGEIFVGTKGKGFYKYSAQSREWQASNTTLRAFEIQSIVITPKDEIIATTNGGVYFSNVNGNGWVYNNYNVPDMRLLALGKNGRVYGTTDKSGIYIAENIKDTPIYSWIDKGIYLEHSYKYGGIYFLKFSKENKYLYTYSSDNFFRKWDLKTGILLIEKNYKGNNIDFDTETEQVYLTFLNKNLYVKKIDFSTDSVLFQTEQIKPDSTDYNSCYTYFQKAMICLSPDGINFITAGTWLNRILPYEETWSGNIDLWNAITGKHIYALSDDITSKTFPNTGGITDLTYSKNGKYIAFSSSYSYNYYHSQRKINYWDVKKSFLLMDKDFNYRHLKNQQNEEIKNTGVKCLDFSYDSKYLIGIKPDNTVNYWNTSDCSFVDNWMPIDSGISQNIKFLKFDKSSRYLITGCENNDMYGRTYNSIKIWDIRTGKVVYTPFINEIDNYGWCIEIAPDGQSFIAGSRDGCLRLFKPKILSDTLYADFYAETTTNAVRNPVKFYDITSAYPSSWKWDFGDGETSIEQNPVHEYKNTGVYTVKLISSDGITTDTIIKKDYINISLHQIVPHEDISKYNINLSPNPFSQTTLISFLLDKEAKVRLTIYNVLGQEIATLIDGKRSAGLNEVEFNGKTLPIGIYYCYINIGGAIGTYPIVLNE